MERKTFSKTMTASQKKKIITAKHKKLLEKGIHIKTSTRVKNNQQCHYFMYYLLFCQTISQAIASWVKAVGKEGTCSTSIGYWHSSICLILCTAYALNYARSLREEREL